jgi:hypothetical protein
MRCLGIIGLLLGHSFEARYSIEEESTGFHVDDFPDGAKVKISGETPTRTYSKQYHGDVCERCGETRNGGGEP